MPLPPLTARRYLTLGLTFMALKYAGDAALVYLGTGLIWTPADYATSLLWNASHKLDAAPGWLLWAMGLWVIPFLFIGVRLTLRRLADARWSLWLVLLFCVPFANYLLMLALVAAPTATDLGATDPRAVPRGLMHRGAAAGVAMGAGGLVGILAIGLTVQLLRNYGAAMFVATPFTMGLVAGYLYRRNYPLAQRSQTMAVGLGSVTALAVFVLAIGWEGLFCLFMALPIGGPIVVFGASVGYTIASGARRTEKPIALGLCALPMAMLLEPSAGVPQPPREVLSVVEIAATPEHVWPHVVSFRPLDPPRDLLFRAGVAYPKSARIEGAGVGAVRYCEFSTGAFVEPITAWEPGRRLAFDVTSSPPPMREWSLYDEVRAPHLDGFLQSRRGEFRLIPLPGGRTRLEGRTWYQVRMAPEWYWRTWSDVIIHRIHARVLDHIRTESTQ